MWTGKLYGAFCAPSKNALCGLLWSPLSIYREFIKSRMVTDESRNNIDRLRDSFKNRLVRC